MSGADTPGPRGVPGWTILLFVATFVGVVAAVIVLGKSR